MWALALPLAALLASAEPATPPLRRVLFVGNSLTYAHDVPGLVAALAEVAGQPPLETASVARPDFSLEDHWREGEARRRIREGGWDVVVLQQGPSSLPESREGLVRWTRRFAAEIREAGAEPALYMVWPGAQRRHVFGDVSASYRAAARAVNGRLLPAGDAWQAAWRRVPDAPLYGPDGFHPGPAGAYLAALTIYAGLYGVSPEGLPATLHSAAGALSIPASLAGALQEAAAEAAGSAGSAEDRSLPPERGTPGPPPAEGGTAAPAPRTTLRHRSGRSASISPALTQ